MTAATTAAAFAAGRFVRGTPWPAAPGVAYPRADPTDAARLPADTWAMASIPAGVRLELVGDANGVRLDVETATDDLGYRGEAAGTTFAALVGDELLDEAPAVRGRSMTSRCEGCWGMRSARRSARVRTSRSAWLSVHRATV